MKARAHRGVALVAGCLLAACFSERSVSEPSGRAACQLPLDAVSRGDRIVVIRGQRFLPDTVQVAPGQAVTWVNCEDADADPHTSTAADAAWDSPLLRAGDGFTHAFAEAGDYPYSCLPHPHMRGVVRVR